MGKPKPILNSKIIKMIKERYDYYRDIDLIDERVPEDVPVVVHDEPSKSDDPGKKKGGQDITGGYEGWRKPGLW